MRRSGCSAAWIDGGGVAAELRACVERQRLGLAPVTLNPNGWTVADLMRWWLETYSRQKEAHDRNVATVRIRILPSALAARRLEHVRPGEIEKLLQSKEGELKITERRYGHLLPDFMKSEVDRLRFGLDRLAPKLSSGSDQPATGGSDSQGIAGVGGRLGTPVVRTGGSTKEEAGTPAAFALEIPASLLAGCRGLEVLNQ